MHIREREILFGEKALFSVFAPMMAFICTNNRSFKVISSVTVVLKKANRTGPFAPKHGCYCSLQIHVCQFGLL